MVFGLVGLGTAVCRGAVVLEDTQLFGENNDDDTPVTLSLDDFTIQSNDLLVVAFAQEHNDGPGGGVDGVQYGGQAMTRVAFADRSDGTNTALAGIWAIDPANGTSDITLYPGVVNIRFISSVVYLSGVKAKAEAVDEADLGGTPITAGPISVSAGAFVLDSFAESSGNSSTTEKGLSESGIGGDVLQENLDTAFSKLAASTVISGSEQNLSTTWENDSDERAALVVASFAEIPEPAAATLLLLAGVAILRRRR
jgi:hypothetical protein